MGLRKVRFTGALLAAGVVVAIGAQVGVFGSEIGRSPSKEIRGVSRKLNAFWQVKAERAGISYRPPARIRSHTKPLSTACGRIPMGDSFYCLGDHSIYLDNRYHARLTVELGDYASGVLVAHEFAHHIQSLMNWPWSESNRMIRDGAALELHADCLAGVSTGSALERGSLTRHDLDDARAWMLSHGDLEHGSGSQRQAWFSHGVRWQSLEKCASVYSAGMP